jgi:hypothetical protein
MFRYSSGTRLTDRVYIESWKDPGVSLMVELTTSQYMSTSLEVMRTCLDSPNGTAVDGVRGYPVTYFDY